MAFLRLLRLLLLADRSDSTFSSVAAELGVKIGTETTRVFAKNSANPAGIEEDAVCKSFVCFRGSAVKESEWIREMLAFRAFEDNGDAVARTKSN